MNSPSSAPEQCRPRAGRNVAGGGGYLLPSMGRIRSLRTPFVRCVPLSVSSRAGPCADGRRKISASLCSACHPARARRLPILPCSTARTRCLRRARGRTAHESIFNLNDGNFRCPNSQQGYFALHDLDTRAGLDHRRLPRAARMDRDAWMIANSEPFGGRRGRRGASPQARPRDLRSLHSRNAHRTAFRIGTPARPACTISETTATRRR